MLLENFDEIYGIFIDVKYKDEFPRLAREVYDRSHKKLMPFINGAGKILPSGMYHQINDMFIPDNWQSSPGSFYHTRAFKAILQKALNEGKRHIFIFEDDAVFKPFFDNTVREAKRDLPNNWDMFFYGCNHSGFKVTTLSPHLLRVHNCYTTHAIGIKNTMFQKIIDLPEENTIDDMMNMYLLPKAKAYSLWPNAVVQRPGFSMIVGRNVDYTPCFDMKGEEL